MTVLLLSLVLNFSAFPCFFYFFPKATIDSLNPKKENPVNNRFCCSQRVFL